MKTCEVCKSLVIEGKCTNEKCGTGNRPPWHRNMKLLPKSGMTEEERAELRADLLTHEKKRITNNVLRTCRFLTLAILTDGFTTTECTSCGAKWDWEDPEEVKHCPDCGMLVDWESPVERRGSERGPL